MVLTQKGGKKKDVESGEREKEKCVIHKVQEKKRGKKKADV